MHISVEPPTNCYRLSYMKYYNSVLIYAVTAHYSKPETA